MATQYTCSLSGVYRPPWLVQPSHHCSHMCIPVRSPWLPGYITITQTILIIIQWLDSFQIDLSIPRSGSAGSYGNSTFRCLSNLHTVFQSCYTILLSHPPTMHKCSDFFTSSSTLVTFHLLFVIATLTDVRWYLMVVFIFTSLIIIEVEDLFMYLLAICMSLEKCLFKLF